MRGIPLRRFPVVLPSIQIYMFGSICFLALAILWANNSYFEEQESVKLKALTDALEEQNKQEKMNILNLKEDEIQNLVDFFGNKSDSSSGVRKLNEILRRISAE